MSALVWLAVKLWALLAFVFATIVALLRWLLRPKGDTPFDVLKHYVSVILAVVGVVTLLWSVKQIAYPPLVITVAKLPDPLEKEYWLNPEISRALIAQIERMRALVKGERDPAFEAVLNPPNIVVKTGDWSFNVQEQLLTPLGSLLGRSQGEVHLALTCYQPGCARTSDPDCREPVVSSTPGDTKVSPKHFLCLRVSADIRRGAIHRRITSRLALSNDTYDADMTKEMARIAESVTSVADPATAALYFYRRVRQEGAASRSITTDPDVVAELRGEAFKAAEQAEAQDSASACWAHSVRAHLAIDRREFSLAETYIVRAKDIPWWRHLSQLALPIDCRRLIVIAEMALAQRLAVRSGEDSFPPYPGDENESRQLAAYQKIEKLLNGRPEGSAAWAGFIEKSIRGSDLTGALMLTQSEIGLNWFTPADQCRLLEDQAGPEKRGSKAAAGEIEQLRIQAWSAIQASVKTIKTLLPEQRLSPLTRQATLDFMGRFSPNKECIDRVQSLAQQLYRNHPNDPEMAQLLAGLIEAGALAAGGEGSFILERASVIYERMIDIGDDKIDVFALSRLAFIRTAFLIELGAEDKSVIGPPPQVLQHITRAWRRFQRQLYPTDVRHHAEFILSFWGALLLLSYPDEVTSANLSSDSDDRQMKSAVANNMEFQHAFKILFPGEYPARLADFPKLTGIGARVGCLCLLARMTGDGGTADYFMTHLNKWQQRTTSLLSCRGDLLPPKPAPIPARVTKSAETASAALAKAKAAFEAASPVSAAVQAAFEKAKAASEQAQAALERATDEFEGAQETLKNKQEKLAEAEKLCRVSQKN